MFPLKFLCVLLVSAIYVVSSEGIGGSISTAGFAAETVTSPILNALRGKRSALPVPQPHHHRRKYYKYAEPVYVAVPVQPVYQKPVHVYQSGGCNTCGGYGHGGYGGGGFGGFGGSHSQASSQASSQSFSAGLNSPFGSIGFSGSSAQSSAQSGSSGYSGYGRRR